MRPLTSTLLITAFTLSLASCSTVPRQDDLISGIDKTQLAQNASKARLPTDPVCVDFYSNVTEFQKQAQSNRSTRNFFSSIGLNVASAVVANQVVPAGIGNQTGRIAANTAARSATNTGSRIALRELNSSDRADAKVIEVANEIGCPVNVKP